jgi:NADH dehydrogenase
VIEALTRSPADNAGPPGRGQVEQAIDRLPVLVIRDRAAGHAVTRKPFRYIDKGKMATIGRTAAVARVGPLRLHGLPAG